MVLAYHCIFSTYGFWLPNDPRGSWSDCVRKWELLAYGRATKVSTRRSVADRPHDVRQRQQAKQALDYPEVRFDGVHARAVARGFATAISEAEYVVHACSILPQHVHLVIARHERSIEQIVRHLKGRATQQLRAESVHPLADYAADGESPPTPWSRGLGWKVFLYTHADVVRSIQYVENNPIRDGKPRQQWSFIVPFEV